MKKGKMIFFITMYIIIIFVIVCLIHYKRQPRIIEPRTGDMNKRVKDYIYEVAKTYCESKISDFKEYVCIENKHIENTNSYVLLFKKENDLLFISITLNEEVTAFETLKESEVGKYSNIEIDNVKVNNFIEEELKKMYGSNFKKFTEKERKLKILDDKFILECSVETELKNGKPFFKDDLLLYMIGE